METKEQMRAAFEEWYANWFRTPKPTRVGEGYILMHPQHGWETWQAALASRDHPPQSSISWSGFNVYGDKKSLQEVERCIHEAGTVPELKQQIKDARNYCKDALASQPHPVSMPDWPATESLPDIKYAQYTPESWDDDYRNLWQRLQVAERNQTIMRSYARELREFIASQDARDWRRDHGANAVRYCPSCASVGEVGRGHRDCCPDGNTARMVRPDIAEQAAAGFRSLYLRPQPAAQGVPDVKAMVDRFLAWPLPETVSSDMCVTMRDALYINNRYRTGTNLLTATEAEEMFRYVLAAAPDGEGKNG
jgi:hypothetical protein